MKTYLSLVSIITSAAMINSTYTLFADNEQTADKTQQAIIEEIEHKQLASKDTSEKINIQENNLLQTLEEINTSNKTANIQQIEWEVNNLIEQTMLRAWSMPALQDSLSKASLLLTRTESELLSLTAHFILLTELQKLAQVKQYIPAHIKDLSIDEYNRYIYLSNLFFQFENINHSIALGFPKHIGDDTSSFIQLEISNKQLWNERDKQLIRKYISCFADMIGGETNIETILVNIHDLFFGQFHRTERAIDKALIATNHFVGTYGANAIIKRAINHIDAFAGDTINNFLSQVNHWQKQWLPEVIKKHEQSICAFLLDSMHAIEKTLPNGKWADSKLKSSSNQQQLKIIDHTWQAAKHTLENEIKKYTEKQQQTDKENK